jgi:hypothetical protein
VGIALGVDKDIRRLQVAVQNATLVGMIHGVGHGGHQFGRVARIRGKRGELGFEVRTLDQLHAEVAVFARLADFKDRHDVGMVEFADGLGLDLKAPELIIVGQGSLTDHLDGDGPIHAHLPSPIHDAHAAPAEHFEQLVIAQIPDARSGRSDRVAIARSDARVRRLRRFDLITDLDGVAWDRARREGQCSSHRVDLR